MQEIIASIEKWNAQEKSMALATVIRTWGSAPRGVGAKMVVTAEGDMAGSVSGGCVEGAVVEAGMACLQTRETQFLQYGVTDDVAWEVGLACGGQIDVFVRPLDMDLFSKMIAAFRLGRKLCNAIVALGPAEAAGSEFWFVEDRLASAPDVRRGELVSAVSGRVPEMRVSQMAIVQIGSDGDCEIFMDVIQPPPLLVIVGGVHIAISLITLANTLGYRTILIDPRKKFGNRKRFPHADQIINAWPEAAFKEILLTPSTAVAVLTHDPKIDDPALRAVLPSPAFYVGALGSQKTQNQRRQRLLGMGLIKEDVDRLHGPIGLGLGGNLPEEIALGIMAEIVRFRHQRV